MKKSNLILLIVTIMLLVFIFSACGELSGASAYDIALKNGFVGTEQEWLDSLKGDRGTDGIDGANGTNGLNGANGTNGLDGENGINGLNGIDGATVILPDEDINNISYAFSKAILSAVKIVAKHTVNKYLFNQFAGTEEQSFTGAGVIYTLDKNSGDAYIITNYHVLYHKTSLSDNKISNDISVFLYGMDYEQYAISATYIGGSLTYDIAVIKVSASEILKNSISQPVSLSSEEVLPGLKTIAIGNPLSDGLSVTSGIVNVASEYYTNTGADDVTTIDFRAIKIDTPVNGGNSGGGLFNLKGELIGIVNAKQKSVEIDNVGYAIPLEIAIGVAQNLIDNCNESNEKVKKCLL